MFEATPGTVRPSRCNYVDLPSVLPLSGQMPSKLRPLTAVGDQLGRFADLDNAPFASDLQPSS